MGSMSRLQRSVMPALLVLLWLLAGCTRGAGQPPAVGSSAVPTATNPAPTPAERDLPFETIERSDHSEYYALHPSEPQHVFLITSAEEASRLAGWVSPQAQEALAQLDYQRYFVIALFRGTFGSSGYDAIIQRITRQEDRLVVHVRFWGTSPYWEATAATSQPYHVVKVVRDGGPLREADLALDVQNVTPTPPAEIRRLTATPPP